MQWRTLVGLMLIILLLPVALAAQAASPQPAQAAEEYRNHWGFGFMSPGFTNDPSKVAIWHIGGGYEWLLTRSVGFNMTAGMAVAGVEGADFAFPVSANGSYYFRRASAGQRALTPFVSAGYTHGGFSESLNMVNVGVGFNQWTQGWSGFRFEVRPHVSLERGPNGRTWFVDFRLGFAG